MSSPHHPLRAPARDSLELASLASSSHGRGGRDSGSSAGGGPPSSRESSFSRPCTPPNGHRTTTGGGGGGGGGRLHGRSASVSSSAFDFSRSLFPLSASGPASYTALGTPHAAHFDPAAIGPGGASLERHKSLTYLNGLSLVVGLIIGSGIFSSPASVNTNAGSPAAALIVWVVSGVLAWTGAASYAELGGAIPLNGGAQIYLSKIWGEWAGFLFTWCAVVVLKPGSAAIIAIVFGEYVARAVFGAPAGHASAWVDKGVALSGLVVVTGLNCISTKLGTRSADFFMFFKFAALLAVAGAGVAVAVTGRAYHREDLSRAWKSTSWFAGTSTSSSEWAVALYAGLWAYDGWDNTNYVTGEMVHAGRDLPRVIHTALPVVISSYILANLSYIFVLPTDRINQSNTIAVSFGSTVLGPLGSLVLALAVAGSCFGALNATTFTAGRLVYSAGKEGYMPELFGTIGFSRTSRRTRLPRRGARATQLTDLVADEHGFFYTPIYAMVLNAVLAIIYVVVGDFTTLTTFYGVASYLFYFATVVGLIVLRVREPDLDRPYKCWITTPVIFCCVSLFLLSRAVFAKPLQALVVLAFLTVGVPLYWWRVGSRRTAGRRGERRHAWRLWRSWGWGGNG